ncbi:MAG: hypothetical protein H6595_03435 [Flavobacteriales bacterium]|nr:hypothetical protein [Flavobacteriales bacterium]MCB9166511.1 hypothetical protein [Flavobacteriales bacterium]
MSAAVFEARWNRIRHMRENGYEELSDFLGLQAGLGPAVRCGLLRRREENGEFQRYHGYVPTEKGSEYLVHLPEKELIMVRPGKSASLFNQLKKDPMPDAVFKATYALPTREQFQAVELLHEQAGRDLWKVQRAQELHRRLLLGYSDLRTFTTRTGVGEGILLRLELCAPLEDRPHDRALSVVVNSAGAPYLELVERWALLLVKPGMELPLWARCEPERSAYWCGVPE